MKVIGMITIIPKDAVRDSEAPVKNHAHDSGPLMLGLTLRNRYENQTYESGPLVVDVA